MALRVLLQIEIKPGSEDEFERLWRTHADRVRAFAANHGQSLSRRTDQAGGYVVVSDWSDEAAFRAFEHSDAQQEYLKKLWPLRQSGSMTLLDTLHDLAEPARV
jgi:heme oxygenase (mycobilin-producing)